MKRTLLLLGYMFLFSSLAHSEENRDLNCEEPQWVSPAESQDGVFHGDLEMKCTARLNHLHIEWKTLKESIQNKIEHESTLHSGPIPIQVQHLKGQQWDVSHLIQEDGNSIIIREIAALATDLSQTLIYETHSKEVKAQGLASYLHSVHFSVKIQKLTPSDLQFTFRNQVSVKRPWFALDLLFAPIARKTCRQKMGQIKEKLFPWMRGLL